MSDDFLKKTLEQKRVNSIVRLPIDEQRDERSEHGGRSLKVFLLKIRLTFEAGD